MRPFSVLLLSSMLLFAAGEPLAAQTVQLPPGTKLQKARPALTLEASPQLSRSLSTQQKLDLYNRARGVQQLPPVTVPPASSTRITAAQPVSSAGASVRQARPTMYLGPSDRDPDGVFVLGPSQPNGGGSFLKVTFPSESGKLYLLDCTVRTDSGAMVDFSPELGAAVGESAAPVNDHVLVVVRATGTQLTRVLQSRAQAWWWSACDIAPAS